MDFPIQSFMDEDACFRFLLDLFHPQGLHCPRCQAQDGFAIHRYVREPVLDYRCTACGRVFNAWTRTHGQLVLHLNNHTRSSDRSCSLSAGFVM